MRIAPLTVAIVTAVVVIWMASFGPKVGRLYAEDHHAQPPAAQANGANAPTPGSVAG